MLRSSVILIIPDTIRCSSHLCACILDHAGMVDIEWSPALSWVFLEVFHASPWSLHQGELAWIIQLISCLVLVRCIH